jgi:phosphoribosylformylglycinamidine synthase
MKFAIIVFPGSNCDYDAYYVISNHLKAKVDFIWHKESDLKDYDCIIIPGGFSYGDYLRAGAIAQFSRIMDAIKVEAKKGKSIIGICNGFQILVESGLLPGALITNNTTRFISKTIKLKVTNSNSLFTKNYQINEEIEMPIAHKQGNYHANRELINSLEENNQIAFKYINNPNGSSGDIAGILNKNKNILGMMPHPERAAELLLGTDRGVEIFKSMLHQVL